VADCIGYLREEGLSRIEAQAEAEENWVAHVREVAGGSLRSTCSSWYIGANVPGKPRVFMPYIGGFPAYVQKCDAVAANGYGCQRRRENASTGRSKTASRMGS
jgi:cyclohexanone monooxygenase